MKRKSYIQNNSDADCGSQFTALCVMRDDDQRLPRFGRRYTLILLYYIYSPSVLTLMLNTDDSHMLSATHTLSSVRIKIVKVEPQTIL